MTAGTEVAALTREREQIHVRAGIVADAREPVVEHAAGEERVRDLRDHGAARAVLARETVVADRLQGAGGAGDPKAIERAATPWGAGACRRRGPNGARCRRAFSEARCVTGIFASGRGSVVPRGTASGSTGIAAQNRCEKWSGSSPGTISRIVGRSPGSSRRNRAPDAGCC